jgi:hypothetical protein
LKSLSIFFLNGYLLIFHIFISHRKQTTYEFMILRLQKRQVSPDESK